MKTIPALDYLAELQALGFKCWAPRDDVLFCPAREWLDNFAEYLQETLAVGSKEAWDCDDYALNAVVQASIACKDAELDSGHTFIYVTVRLWGDLLGVSATNLVGHALNLVRTDDGALWLFEPQNGRFCDAKVEIDSGTVVPVHALL